MINLEINDRTTGLLVLLLTLLLFYSLKAVFPYSRPAPLPHNEHFFIQIEGDVRSPGVYGFSHHPTLIDLISRAGGLSSAHTPPRIIRDFSFPTGAKVAVLRDGEEYKFHQTEMSAFHKITLGIPISLNRETEEGLMAIPGIGLELAKSIVQERSKRRGFKSLDEIVSIKGVSHKLFTKIKPYLTL